MIERTPGGTADVVVMDVFRAGAVAVHPAAVGFLREIARILRPSGLYLGNTWSAADLALPPRAVASPAEVFPHVLLLAEPGLPLGEREGNVVLAASDRELPHRALTAWAESAGSRVFCLSAAQLAAFRGVAPPLTAEHPADAVTPVPRWSR